MSTIRCPMCGKENDDQAERCNFCRAALKSFNISETPAEPSSGDDWLSSLRSETTPDEEPSIEKESPAEAEQTENEEAPDWLQRIRQRNAEENGNAVTGEQSEQESDQNDQEEEGIPSWLRGLEETPVDTGETGGEETPQQPDTDIPANLPEEEIPQAEEGDWLSSLREPVQAETIPTSDEFQTLSEELTEEKAIPEGEEGEDFLKNLAAWQSSQAEVEEGKTEVTSPVIEESDHPQEQTFSEDMPAFRQPEFFSQESTDSYNPDEQKQSEEDEQPEWLKSLQQIAGVPESVDIPAGEGDLPDWLQDLDQSASTVQESSELAEIESVTESDFSDRIQEISESTENAAFDSEEIAEVQAFDTSAEPVIAEEFQAIAPDLPDAGFFTTQDFTEIPAAEEASEPEWLSNLREAAPGDLPESPSPFNEDELPEWLNGTPESLPDENAVCCQIFK